MSQFRSCTVPCYTRSPRWGTGYERGLKQKKQTKRLLLEQQQTYQPILLRMGPQTLTVRPTLLGFNLTFCVQLLLPWSLVRSRCMPHLSPDFEVCNWCFHSNLGIVGTPHHTTPLLLRVVAIVKTKNHSTSFYPKVEDERVDVTVSSWNSEPLTPPNMCDY
jgi:hypothetical protein